MSTKHLFLILQTPSVEKENRSTSGTISQKALVFASGGVGAGGIKSQDEILRSVMCLRVWMYMRCRSLGITRAVSMVMEEKGCPSEAQQK